MKYIYKPVPVSKNNLNNNKMRRIFVFLPIAAIVFILFSCSKSHDRLNAPYFYWYTQRLDSLRLKTGTIYRESSSSATDTIIFNYDSSISEIAYMPATNKEDTITFRPTMPEGFQVAMSLPNQSINLLLTFDRSLLYKNLCYNPTIVFAWKNNEVDITGGSDDITIGF
jgi:hypothetical protein